MKLPVPVMMKMLVFCAKLRSGRRKPYLMEQQTAITANLIDLIKALTRTTIIHAIRQAFSMLNG
jgi:hypothetical protein